MRPNVEFTRDPLRVELMPSTEGMELDYRTQPFSAATCRWEAIYVVVQLGVSGFFLTLTLRCFLRSKLTLAEVVAFRGGPTSYSIGATLRAGGRRYLRKRECSVATAA